MSLLLIAIILGVVEGVTEFLPVSSTGHLILATELLGFDAAKWAAFNVIIQLGAILAIVVLYWRTFWAVLEGLFRRNAMSWRFVRNVLIAFLPAAVLGVILIKHIEALLGEREGRRGRADRRRRRHPRDRALAKRERRRWRRRNAGQDRVGSASPSASRWSRGSAGRARRSWARCRSASTPHRSGIQLLPRRSDDARRDHARVRQTPP